MPGTALPVKGLPVTVEGFAVTVEGLPGAGRLLLVLGIGAGGIGAVFPVEGLPFLLPIGAGVRRDGLFRQLNALEDLFLFLPAHHPPGAGGQFLVQLQAADGNAPQEGHLQAHVLAEAAHLPFPAFAKGHFQGAMAFLHPLFLHGKGPEEFVVVIEPLQHPAAEAGGELPVALHIVALENLPGGVHHLLGVVPVIGQHQQTLGVPVQASHGEEASEALGNQIEDQALRMGVLGATGEPHGLVQEKVHLPLGMALHQAPLKADLVLLRVHVVGGGNHRLPVDRHTPLQNQLLAIAAGGYARGSQELRQTLLLPGGAPLLHHILGRLLPRRLGTTLAPHGHSLGRNLPRRLLGFPGKQTGHPLRHRGRLLLRTPQHLFLLLFVLKFHRRSLPWPSP